MKLITCLTLIAFLAFGRPALAQETLLTDLNGDGVVTVLAFGDSITFGVGDGFAPGIEIETLPQPDATGGYPARVEVISGTLVDNEGLSGEIFTLEGIARLPDLVKSSSADVVVILEGANDATNRVAIDTFHRSMQRAINIIRALGREVVLATLPPSCCLHEGRGPFLNGYNGSIRELVTINSGEVADVEQAWATTCTSLPDCELLNLPEGLHPNQSGYDVMAHTILATLAGIDIFAADGAATLEAEFGLAPGTVTVKPAVF